MVENRFYDKIKIRLMTGESTLAFRQVMLSNFSNWNEIESDEIIDLLDSIKENELSLYAFLNFWYGFIGIDLFDLYKKMNENKWKSDLCREIIKNFDKYPKNLSLIDIGILEKNNLNLASFRIIRRRLIGQGLTKVKYVKICF